jgi:hypothetical protein
MGRLRRFARGSRGVLVMLLLCCCVAVLFSLRSADTDRTKATWLWDTEWIRDSGEDIVSFCRTNGVNLIYLQISARVEQTTYREFIRKANEAGIDVHALNGAPEWAKERHEEEGKSFIRWVSDYNRQAAEGERFAGVHLDVEPYLLPEWKQDEASLVHSWLDNMESWLEEGREAGLYMAADVPFWLPRLDMPTGNGKVSSWMLEQFDSLTIMAYRDNSDSIYESSKKLLLQADKLGKPIVIGLELGKTNEGGYLSFHGKPLDYFEEQLRDVKELGASHSSFAGAAVHHLRIWYDRVN